MQEVFIGNTGEMYKITDRENGQEYYFKPAVSKAGNPRPYRAYIQEAAYQIQQIINPEVAVKCNTIEVDGVFGAIQEKISVNQERTKSFIDYFDSDIGKLTETTISQIIDEYLVDYCLCNYDAHASNFIIDLNGRLRGIDKEQAFRYIKEDINNDMMFNTNYNESYGEAPTIYNILFEQMKKGKVSTKYLNALRYRASRLAQVPDEKYIEIFKKYAYGKAKTPVEAEILLNSILDRKRNILQNIEQLYNEIRKSYSENYKGKNNCFSILSSGIEATEDILKSEMDKQGYFIEKNINKASDILEKV